MGPELAVFRAIIELFWPTLCLAKMAILNTVHRTCIETVQIILTSYCNIQHRAVLVLILGIKWLDWVL